MASFSGPSGPRASLLRALASALTAGVLFASCTSIDRPPLRDADVLAAVRTRAQSQSELAQALELANVTPLAVPRPSAPDALDPRADEFWQACAFAFSRDVRDARRKFLAAEALIASAGAPEPIGLRLESRDIGGSERDTEVALTFDLLGILGLGRAKAARALANVEARLALAELETSVWRARFAVQRARVRNDAAREREALFEELARDARADDTRLQILERNGRLAPSDIANARAAERMLARRASDARVSMALAREELAVASGLTPERAELDTPNDTHRHALPDAVAADAAPSDEDLLARLPALRAMHLWCALAEARLRSVAAERNPTLRLGPQMIFTPTRALPGAMLESLFAMPGSIDGRVRAALQECERMHEAVADELVMRSNVLRAASRRVELLAGSLTNDVEPTLRAMRRAWQAARTRFAIDANSLAERNDALERRANADLDEIDVLEALALARLDLAEACGPARDRASESESHAHAVPEVVA